jgi:hypothetical protein
MFAQAPASVVCPPGTYVVNIPGSPAILQTPTSISFSWNPAGVVRPAVYFEPWVPPLIAHLPDGSRLINFGQGWLVLPDSGYIP